MRFDSLLAGPQVHVHTLPEGVAAESFRAHDKKARWPATHAVKLHGSNARCSIFRRTVSLVDSTGYVLI